MSNAAETTEATYVIESPDGILLWIGSAESPEAALAALVDDTGADHATAPTIDQVHEEDGQVLATVQRDASGQLTIRDDADGVQYLDALLVEGYELRRESDLAGWGVWRSLWRYTDDDGVQWLVARTIR